MREHNKSVFPSSRLRIQNNQVNSFKFDGKNYITNYNELIEKHYGEEYKGQVDVSIINDMTLYKKLPLSYFNPQIEEALYNDNVKYRTHYGYINDDVKDYMND